jgi:Na+-transporting methylmalonyl-CoA/oxaloacetate decarboxylase beta subunit
MTDKTEISLAGRRFIRALLVICAALLVAEFIIHRHAYFALEATPLFFALFGFAAFCIVVGGGVMLRKFVMRASDYYDGDDDAA